jgi:hypothetical protein
MMRNSIWKTAFIEWARPQFTRKPRAKFVVEWKMIVNKDLNSGDPTLKKWMIAIRYLPLAKRSAPSSAKNLLPPLPIDSLQWTQLAPTFDPRTVRHLNRIMGNFHITALREQVYLISEILERELKVSITAAELSTVFGRKRS